MRENAPSVSVHAEKRIVNTLLRPAWGSLSREAVKAAVAACGLPDNVRGERLGIPEFAALTEALGEF